MAHPKGSAFLSLPSVAVYLDILTGCNSSKVLVWDRGHLRLEAVIIGDEKKEK